MKIVIVAVIAALVLVVVVFALAVRIIRQYERGWCSGSAGCWPPGSRGSG
jgi:hypothetical protein